MAIHQSNAKVGDDVWRSAEGVNALTTINISNAAHTQLTLSTVKTSGAGWVIKTATYSYDGVIHTESYISDL